MEMRLSQAVKDVGISLQAARSWCRQHSDLAKKTSKGWILTEKGTKEFFDYYQNKFDKERNNETNIETEKGNNETKETCSDVSNSITEDYIEELKHQIAVKDEQLKRITESLNNALKSLNAAQQLHGVSMLEGSVDHQEPKETSKDSSVTENTSIKLNWKQRFKAFFKGRITE